MPTTTVLAPRRRVIWAMPLRVRQANESSTSRAVTSTMTPRDRKMLTRATRSSCSWRRSASLRAAWMEAMRKLPCLRIGTCMGRSRGPPSGELRADRADGGVVALDAVAQDTLRLLQAALQVADGVDL